MKHKVTRDRLKPGAYPRYAVIAFCDHVIETCPHSELSGAMECARNAQAAGAPRVLIVGAKEGAVMFDSNRIAGPTQVRPPFTPAGEGQAERSSRSGQSPAAKPA